MRETNPIPKHRPIRTWLRLCAPVISILVLFAVMPSLLHAQEPEPVLIVSKTDNDAVAVPGDTVDYTIGYSYTTANILDSVQFTETVPENTKYVFGDTAWTCLPDTSAGSHCTVLLPAAVSGSDSGKLAFRVQVDEPLLTGATQIENLVEARITGQADTQRASDFTPIVAAVPQLTLTKSDGGVSDTEPGDMIVYALNYANNGTTSATDAVLSETVPPNTTFNVAGSTAGWNCTPDGSANSTCTLSLGILDQGVSGSANFAVTVNNPVSAGITQISNTGTLNATNADAAQASDTTPITAAPNLSLTKSDGGATTAPGGTVSYTLNYANSGNQNAASATLEETVPADTTFNAAASTQGWSCAANAPGGTPCTLAVGTIPGGGGSGSATFVVNVSSSVNRTVSQIENSATLKATNASSAQASDSTPILFPPKLTLTKGESPANSTGVPGGVIEYTLSYGNTGDQAATVVTIQEVVPANTTFDGPAGQWTCVPGLVREPRVPTRWACSMAVRAGA